MDRTSFKKLLGERHSAYSADIVKSQKAVEAAVSDDAIGKDVADILPMLLAYADDPGMRGLVAGYFSDTFHVPQNSVRTIAEGFEMDLPAPFGYIEPVTVVFGAGCDPVAETGSVVVGSGSPADVFEHERAVCRAQVAHRLLSPLLGDSVRYCYDVAGANRGRGWMRYGEFMETFGVVKSTGDEITCAL